MSLSSEQHLTEISQQIGNIADANCHYTTGLAARIRATGKELEQLTVAELIALDDQHRDYINGGCNEIESANSGSISLDELLTRQEQSLGFEIMPLEVGLLLQRVKDGGYSGDFLAEAFISSYRTDQPFNYPLGKIIKLDWEGVRLFHQILHIRNISGWSDQSLYEIEQQIKAIQAKECQ